jgi:hypothetical protein
LTYYGFGVLFTDPVTLVVLSITLDTRVHVRVSLAHVDVIVAHVSASLTRAVLFTDPVTRGVLFIGII